MTGKKWTKEETEKLKSLAKKYSRYKYITPHFDRSKNSIAGKLRNLGMTLKNNVDVEFF